MLPASEPCIRSLCVGVRWRRTCEVVTGRALPPVRAASGCAFGCRTSFDRGPLSSRGVSATLEPTNNNSSSADPRTLPHSRSTVRGSLVEGKLAGTQLRHEHQRLTRTMRSAAASTRPPSQCSPSLSGSTWPGEWVCPNGKSTFGCSTASRPHAARPSPTSARTPADRRRYSELPSSLVLPGDAR